MRIIYERSGGLMGRKVKLSLDLSRLPRDQAEALKRLIEEADFFHLPEKSTASPVPDEFTYTITVETVLHRHMVRITDSGIPAPLRPLLDELSIRARSNQSNK